MMETFLQTLLAEMQKHGRAHDACQQDPNKKMLNLRPETALLVSILVRSSRRTRLLEVGTSNGYSTIWLAWAAAAHGGRVISIDHSAEKLALADANLRRARLRHIVDLQPGDAAEVVRTLPGPFDFVFFDSVRMRPEEPLKPLLPKLSEDALILADNVLSHQEGMRSYLGLIAEHPAFTHAIVPVGKGLSVAYRSGASKGLAAAA